MGKFINIEGQKFNRWFVKRLIGLKKRIVYWECVCECGTVREVGSFYLRSGASKSCGCLNVEISTTHGLTNTLAYISWAKMKGRCLNPDHHAYDNYGGRGIKVCPEWMDFETFYKDMGDRHKGWSIERIDVNGDYSKENCRWATRKEQGQNRRNTVNIEVDGIINNVTQWSEKLGIAKHLITRRLRVKGMGVTIQYIRDQINKKQFINI